MKPTTVAGRYASAGTGMRNWKN